MSLPPYNPFTSGNQNAPQGQYGLSNTHTERDPRRGSSYSGHSSVPSSSATLFGIPENSGGMMASSRNYRSDASRMTRDEDATSSMDMHISKAREEARLHISPLHQHREQVPPFTGTQGDELRSSGTGVASYLTTSASSSRDTHRAVIQSSNTNFSWLANCARLSSDGSGLKSSPALSNFARGGGGQFDTSSEGQNKMQAIPGLGDYEYPAPDQPEASTEPKYTSESAASILQRFGLEKGDLEHLISYPEDQITPANLPFILRKIRLEKDKKTTAGLQPSPTASGPDSFSLSRVAEMHIEETSSSILQPSKVIDYGHTGKYTAGAGDDIGRKSDKDSAGSKNLFMMDTAVNRSTLEPLHKNPTDMKSSAMGSSCEQGISPHSSPYSFAPSFVASSSSDQTIRLPTQPSPTYQNILSSFLLPKKETALRGLTSEAPKPVPVKQPEGGRQAAKAPVSPHCRHPSRPGLVLIGSNDPSDSKGTSKTKIIEHITQKGKQKEQTKQQPIKQQQKTLVQPAQEQQSKQQTKQSLKKTVPETRKVLPPTSRKSTLSTGSISSQNKPLTSKKQHKDKDKIPKDQPTPAMMFDYSATPPRVYPHTCSLCNKECTSMQDWISHQNSSLHLESCTRLRKQYPKWGGEIVLEPRAAGKDAKPSTSTSAKKPRRGNRSKSKSLSPHHRTGSTGRKDKQRSRSRSPQSYRYSRRYEIPGSHRSQSPERRTSPKRKDDRHSSPRRTRDRRSPVRRSNESLSPPRKVDNRWSPPRKTTGSRSPPRRVDNRRSPLRRTTETWSPPRRTTETWSPPRRGDDRQSPLRRTTETWSPPRRTTETWSPPRRTTETWSPPRMGDDRQSPLRRSGNRWPPSKRSDNSRSPQRRSQERRSSREGSSPQRKGSNSAESLAKKLMETSAVQSLSHMSDLEAVVKTLAPALLAELAKMTTSSPSPLPSAKRKKLSSASSSSSSLSSSTTKVKSSGKLPSKSKLNEVELSHVCDSISCNDLGAAVGQFGKTVSIKIHRETQRAQVQFEKTRPAENLRLAGSFRAKGTTIFVVQGKRAVTEKQTKTLVKKHATSSAQTTTTRKVLLPTPGIPPLLGTVRSSKVNQRLPAKDLARVKGAKGASGVSKAKVLVSKAKSISTKKISKKCTASKEKVVKKALATAPKEKLDEKPVPLETDAASTAAPVKVVDPENMEDTNQMKDPGIEEKVLAVQKPEASAETDEKVEESAALPFKSEAPDTEELPEQSDQGSAVVLKGTVEDDPVREQIVSGSEKDPLNGKTVLVSQAETVLTPQRPLMDKPKETDVKDTNAPPRPPNAESSKLNQAQPKLQGSSEAQTDTAESGKASPPTMVKLHGVCSSLSHSEVVSAVECFGKTKSVVLFRARLEAVVIFEKVEDAKKLKTVKSLDVNGTEITVVGDKEAVSKEQKTPLLKKPASSAPLVSRPTGVTAAAIGNVLVPVAKRVSTQEIIKPETLASEREVQVKQNTSSDCKSPESQPDAEDSKQTAVQESVVGLMDKSEASEQVKGAVVTAETELIKQELRIPVDMLPVEETVDVRETETEVLSPDLQCDVETSELKESDTADADEPMELEVTEVKAAEPAGICTENPSKSQLPVSLNETEQIQTPVVQQGPLSELQSTAQGQEAGTETAQPAAESTSEAAVESTSTKDASKAAAASALKPTTSQQSSSVVTRLTVGEMLEKHLTPQCIYCWPFANFQPKRLPKGYRQVLISGLPLYYEGFYTEGDICNVLFPFGLQDKNSIYIIPQSRLAIAWMPSVGSVLYLLKESYMNGVYFRGIRLIVEVISSRHVLTPAEFYKFVKRVSKQQSTAADAQKTIFIRNISRSETKELREALKEFAPVTNFMPLLNKLFIEFESIPDACAFKSWHDLRFPTPCHNVQLKREVIRLGRLSAASAEDASKTPGTVSAKSCPSKEETATTSQKTEVSDGQTGSEPDQSESTDTKPSPEAPSHHDVNIITETEVTGVSQNQPESKPDQSETTDTKLLTEALSHHGATEAELTGVSENQPESNPDQSETTDTKPSTEALSHGATVKEAPEESGNQPETNPDQSETTDTKHAAEGLLHGATEKEVTEVSENQPESSAYKETLPISESNLKETAVEDNETTNETPCGLLQGQVLAPKVGSILTLQEPQTEVCQLLQPHGESFQLKQTETEGHGSLDENVLTIGSKDEAKLDKAEDPEGPMELEERGVEAKAAAPAAAPAAPAAAPAAASKQKKPAANRESSSAVIRPTVGEMLETLLFPQSIFCRPSSYLSSASKLRLLLITGLPPYHEGLYAEDDVAELLTPFGFENKADTLFVIPQTCMAFAMMPSGTSVCKIVRECERNGIYFQENPLFIEAVMVPYEMNAPKLYRFLKRRLKCSSHDEAERTVLLTNISQSETKELREALKKFALVTNFMPLLNKLFIEFKAVVDAEQFEGWYRQLSPVPRSEVFRLKMLGPVTESAPKNDPDPIEDSCLTPGEQFGKFEKSLKNKIGSFKCRAPNSPKMLITWPQGTCCPTEDDMVDLLTPFGYQNKGHNLYIFPQACSAFVQMQSTRDVIYTTRASRRKPLMLNGTELSVFALSDRISLRPFWLYRTLMQVTNYSLAIDRDRVIFIRNISESEFKELREVLKRQDSIENILPLLNKVFIEFKTSQDADWLGVWYSLLKNPPDHRIQRLKIPNSYCASPAPKIPKDPYLDSDDVIEGATLPTGKGGIPHGSTSPFWLSLRNSPFVFPTISPWFIIPEYVTVKDMYDIEMASPHGSICPTIMLTGLPEGDYKHEDVARLVWPFLPKQNLHSLFYNVTVLPLQRRAFVFFADWTTCCEFLKAHIDKHSSLKEHAISVHVVTQNMYPESSEEEMYKSLMKLTNAGTLDSSPLEERLLCVGVSEVSLDVITLVIEMVASITTFVNFLPLANRICIEMSDSSGVAQVVEKYNDLSPNSFTEDPAWSKVQHFETLESLRQRLQDSADVTLNLEDNTLSESNPEMDRTSLKSIKVTVGQQRVVEKSLSLSPDRTPGDDFTDHIIPSEAYLFNEEDFVTVDEVYDDTERSPEPHRSSSSRQRERERSKKTKEYKSSSRSSKDSRSSRSSSSKPTTSMTIPSSSTSASQASSSSPLKSPEAPSSPGKSGTKHGVKVSGSTSTGSPSSERANIKSAASAQAAAERLSEGAVSLSDLRVSAESSASETVESETKMEARREMHPPQQRQGSGLNQTQAVEMDVKVGTSKKQKKEEEDDKKTEEDTTLDLSEDQKEDGGPGPGAGLEVNPEKFVEMEVVDSVRGDQEGSLSLKQLSEDDADPKTGKSEDKSAEGETNSAEELEGKVKKPKGREVKDTETGQDQLLQEGGSKDDLKDPDSDITEQAFEILDSIDDQNETDDGFKPKPTEDNTYEVIDSVEDQPTASELENEKRLRSRRRDAMAKRDDRPSRRSDPTSKAPQSDEKQNQTEATTPAQEKLVFESVDSVEEDAAARERSGRRRSTRGKKESGKPEEVTFKVLDSVETVNEPTMTTRSTRGRQGRTSEDVKKEGTPTRRRQTPARESRSKEKRPAPLPSKTDAEAATFEILDSVECVQEDPPATRGKGRRGRPKKQTQTTKTANTKVEGVADEEEATYQILDSVEDEFTDSQPLLGQTESGMRGNVSKNNDEEQKSPPLAEEVEEETMFQVLDCLEDEQVLEEQATTEVSDRDRKEHTEAEEDKQPGFSMVPEASEQLEESLPQRDEGHDDSSPAVGSASGKTEQTSLSPIRSQSVTVTLKRDKSPEIQSPLVNLEKVSDEEEDYPDDTAEEEELRKRQAAAKQKQLTKMPRTRGTSEREERGETRGRVEVDSQELVTLDEVGADEAEDEMAPQALVTLDEFVEGEDQEQSGMKSSSLSQEDESGDDLNHQILVTLDEAGFDEDNKQTRSAKRRHDADTEESVNFVVVDEVKDEENREVTPGTRGRPKKKPRQTPVRKSTRGKTESRIDEGEEERGPADELSSDKDLLKPSSDHQEETASQANVDPSTAEPELGSRTQEGCEEGGGSRMDVKADSKQRRELVGPEAKRSRSQSPSVPHDFLLPDFKPNNPLGKEFVVPGFFCNLCCVFYPNESTAKELHCSSQTHYNNLKRHYRRLQQQSKSSAQSCRESTSAEF
ncbi:uncharacterized protein LOC141784590 isoform X2 [Halichoeres trimaculatus]|uniref:uncharacterized protein LOC141784590 isoform X2 n=1 Tax=Halichoeres trimaculatus TaxID=147232 RepID=UPI003D9DC704